MDGRRGNSPTANGESPGGGGGDDGDGKPVYTQRYIIMVLLFFAGSSLGAIFINKATLSHYKFHFPLSLMLLQSVFTVVVLSVINTFRPALLSLAVVKSHEYPRILVPTLLFIFNVSVGLSALTLVNIPMFSAFRRLTVLFVMTAEYVILHKGHSKKVVFSVIFLTTGAFVSALGDVTFTALGYALVFLNNALTAMYLASIKRLMKDLSLDPLSLLYHTAFLAMPIVFLLCLITGELSDAYVDLTTRKELHTPLFLASLSFVAASAFCVNYSTSLCTHVTSPLTTSVTGQVKNVLQTFLGFFSWGYEPTPLNVIGLLMAMLGQLSFAYYKHKENSVGEKSGNEEEMNAGDVKRMENASEMIPLDKRGSDGLENGMKERRDEKRSMAGNGLPRPAVSSGR